jgi:hypothetical protein
VRVLELLVLTFVVVGCDGSSQGRVARSSDAPPPPVFGEHKLSASSGSALLVGEDCTASGASSCKSGVCLHTLHDRNAGYFCSQSCDDEAACPTRWQCVQTHPSSEGRLCIPPQGWVATAVTAPARAEP